MVPLRLDVTSAMSVAAAAPDISVLINNEGPVAKHGLVPRGVIAYRDYNEVMNEERSRQHAAARMKGDNSVLG